MEISYGEDELQEIIKLNGRIVSNALATLKNNATEREISDYISNYTGQPQNLVAREVREILRFAVGNGFLLKNGNTYTLPCEQHVHDVDCDSTTGGDDPSRGSAFSGEEREAACVGGDPEEDVTIRFVPNNNLNIVVEATITLPVESSAVSTNTTPVYGDVSSTSSEYGDES